MAAQHHEVDAVRMLSKANGVKLDIPDVRGMTPLHIAAQSNTFHVAEVLIAAGANEERTDADGLTPMIIAAQSNADDTFRVLANKEESPIKLNWHRTTVKNSDEIGSNKDDKFAQKTSFKKSIQRILSRKKSSKTAVSVADTAQRIIEPVHKKSLRETFQRVLSKKSSHAQVDMAPQQMEVQVVA